MTAVVKSAGTSMLRALRLLLMTAYVLGLAGPPVPVAGMLRDLAWVCSTGPQDRDGGPAARECCDTGCCQAMFVLSLAAALPVPPVPAAFIQSAAVTAAPAPVPAHAARDPPA